MTGSSGRAVGVTAEGGEEKIEEGCRVAVGILGVSVEEGASAEGIVPGVTEAWAGLKIRVLDTAEENTGVLEGGMPMKVGVLEGEIPMKVGVLEGGIPMKVGLDVETDSGMGLLAVGRPEEAPTTGGDTTEGVTVGAEGAKTVMVETTVTVTVSPDAVMEGEGVMTGIETGEEF